MRENELTIAQIRKMPAWNYNGKNDGNLTSEQIDAKPLWEIDEVVEDRTNAKKAVLQIYRENTERLEQSNSPWLKTIDLMNKRYYKNTKRAENGDYAIKAVMKWSDRTEKEVDRLIKKGVANEGDKEYLVEKYEEYSSNKLFKELSDVKPDKLEQWRREGSRRLLVNALAEDPKFAPDKRHPKSLRNFVEKEHTSIIIEKPQNIQSVSQTEAEKFKAIQEPEIVYTNPKYLKTVIAADLAVITADIAVVASLITSAARPIESKKPILAFDPQVTPNRGRTSVDIYTIKSPIPKIPLHILSTDIPKAAEAVDVTPSHTVYPSNITHESSPQKTAAATKTPESTKEPTPKPTPEPDLYHAGIDFSKEITTTLEIAGVSISTIPLVHEDYFDQEEVAKFYEETASGTNKSQIHIDRYGNTIWGIHTGTENGKPNPGENFRKKVQRGGTKDTDSYLSEEEVQDNVKNEVEKIVRIIQADGTVRQYKVVASGIIPHGELNDKFNEDSKSSTDTVVKATGGEGSQFKNLEEQRGIIVHYCLHGIIPDPNDPKEKLIDQRYETMVFGLVPTEESVIENEKENAPVKQEMEAKMGPLERSARVLKQIINSASARFQDSGNKFKSFVTQQLKSYSIPVTNEASEVIEDVKNETNGDKIQCTMGADLLGTMPGSEETIADTYGWQDVERDKNGEEVLDENGKVIVIKDYDQAYDLITNENGEIDPKLLQGYSIDKENTKIFKIDSFGNLRVGDKIVIPKSPALPNGHVVVVISNPTTDEYGITHLKAFDVNYERGFGLARILEDVTEDNIYDLIAKGQKLNLYVVRPNTNTDQKTSDNN